MVQLSIKNYNYCHWMIQLPIKNYNYCHWIIQLSIKYYNYCHWMPKTFFIVLHFRSERSNADSNSKPGKQSSAINEIQSDDGRRDVYTESAD